MSGNKNEDFEAHPHQWSLIFFFFFESSPHVSEYFWIRNFFFPDTPSVYT